MTTNATGGAQPTGQTDGPDEQGSTPPGATGADGAATTATTRTPGTDNATDAKSTTKDTAKAATGHAGTGAASNAKSTTTDTAKTSETGDPAEAKSTTTDTAKTSETGDATDGKPATTDTAKATTSDGGKDGATDAKAATTDTAKATTSDAGKNDAKAGSDGDEKKDGDGKPRDRWSAFAPAPDPVPGRPRRAAQAVGRLLVHEWTLATLAALALAVGMTWPTLRYPLYTLPQDYWDPSLQAWQMAWSGHALRTEPAQLFHSNTFFPEQWSFAFSDMLLGYAPAGMIGIGPEAAVLRYNIMFVLAHALATLGAYALARQLGAGRAGAAVAGVSYTYAPWLLAQAGHLHIVSNGGIPLALAMLARGHGWSLRYGYRPERRHEGWTYTGWLVAAWQLSLGFGIGLPFAYVLAGIVLVAATTWFLRRWVLRPVKRPFGTRLFVADLVGGLIFAGVGALLAIPYFKVAELHPNAARTLGDIGVYSPPALGFFTAPAESRVWGDLHEAARATLPWHPEMTLLPGFVLYALAAGGLFFSVWKLRQRLLLLAGVLVTMVLAMGTRFFDGTFTYGLLFEHLPGWNGLRTPGRMMLWTTLLLGLLAAGAVSAFADRVGEIAAERAPYRPSPWLRVATVVPVLLVLLEGLNVTPHPVVPEQPVAMRTVDGPMLVLPSSQNLDQPVMLWSTSTFPDLVNGGSGFTPTQLDEVRRVTLAFPDQTSVDYLRTLGVRNVVLLRDQIVGTPWEVTVNAPVDQLGITREEVGDAVVFRL
ncbi:hypothetical protein FHX75_121194 [Micromonospora palomenae]|uniref:Uncharacterized protein n=1 Tax=Micromonospora palomenae TaxID=1461247 RepID=A0A561WFS9_9ACTN|nr:hypothetical protein [Micromonospora palomenae]TWG22661.1 hypothetical protein FHX75_121194 [Micromonospora palomenae]